jgi:Copper type II ascorbate-dependent monooxygenase, C-terminal domain
VTRRRLALGLGAAVVVVIAATTIAAGGSGGSRSGGAAHGQGAPTWSSVAPIFAEKCAGCHTPGGIAPFSLLSAKSAKAHADGILVMTKLGRMPPWMPGHDSPEYLNQSRRILTPAEKQVIARWVGDGARIGSGGSVKPVGATSNAPGTTMTLTPSRSYMPKAAVGGLDDYHCFVLEPHLTQDAFVTSALIKPQRPTIVHHVILFEAAGQNATEARRLNAASGGNGWTCFGGPGLSETHPTTDAATGDRLGAPPWIAAWVPGHANNDLPQGTGVLVHAGAAIVMQVHYNLIHPAKRDRSRAVIRFAPAATTKLTPLNTILVPAPVELPCPRNVHSTLCSRDIAVQQEIKKYGYSAGLIPSGLLYICGKSLADYPQTPASVKSLGTSCDRRVNRPLRIYGVAGHMHTRGVDIRVELNGKTLLHIPRWNFHWQDAYYLAKPVDANPGDVIHVSCRFDNSAIRQPLVDGKLLKPRYVLWGEGTTDEMCLGLLQAADR